MSQTTNTPYLIGYTEPGAVRLKNDLATVADFICNYGRLGDLSITTPDHQLILNTFGTYINKCPDKAYLEKLCAVLVPKQIEMENQLVAEEQPHSQVFSYISMRAYGQTDGVITLASGIPASYADLIAVPGFEEYFTDLNAPGTYHAKVTTYRLGEGEPRDADAVEMRSVIENFCGDAEWGLPLVQTGKSEFSFDWPCDIEHVLEETEKPRESVVDTLKAITETAEKTASQKTMKEQER